MRFGVGVYMIPSPNLHGVFPKALHVSSHKSSPTSPRIQILPKPWLSLEVNSFPEPSEKNTGSQKILLLRTTIKPSLGGEPVKKKLVLPDACVELCEHPNNRKHQFSSYVLL